MATEPQTIRILYFWRRTGKIYHLYCSMGQHWDSLQKFKRKCSVI